MSDILNILCINCCAEALFSIESVFSGSSHFLLSANSCEDVAHKILSQYFSLLIVDSQRLDSDLSQILEVILRQQKYRDIPIIFLVDAADADNLGKRLDFHREGVEHILKPINEHVLKSKALACLNLSDNKTKPLLLSKFIPKAALAEYLDWQKNIKKGSYSCHEDISNEIPQIICRANFYGEVIFCNKFWHSYTGLSLKDSILFGWLSLLHSDEKFVLRKKWLKAFKKYEGFALECCLTRACDRENRWHVLKIVPEYNEFSKIIGWIGTAIDIHDYKDAVKKCLHLKSLVEKNNQINTQNLLNIGEKIYNSLEAILGFMDLLLSHELDCTEKNKCIAVIRHNKELLSGLMDEICEFSNTELGKSTVSSEAISFGREHKETKNLEGMKILLVEDSTDLQILMMHALCSAGAEVELANNGEEGIQKAMNGTHDIVLMDIQMPIIDGYVATERLRASGYKKRIIALTAHVAKADHEKCLQMGCDAYLVKPVNFPQLFSMLKKMKQ